MKILSQKLAAAKDLAAALPAANFPLSIIRGADRDDGDAATLAQLRDHLSAAARLADELQTKYAKRLDVMREKLYGAKGGAVLAAIANARTHKSIRLAVALPDTKCGSPHIAVTTLEAAAKNLCAAKDDLITLAGYDIAATDPGGNTLFTVKSIYNL